MKLRPSRKDGWTVADMPRQDGRRCVVTGANSGIGFEVAKALAGAGAEVVLAVRDVDKGATAAAQMPGSTSVEALDLASLASVRAFVDRFEGDIDVLVNNAGIMAVAEGRTEDGFELQIGTNHLGHFALTCLLAPRLRERVVTVSSNLHRQGVVRLEDLNWEEGRYQPWAAYGQAKLANLLFTTELQRRLDESGSRVRATAAHPGYSGTSLQTRTGNPVVNAVSALANQVVATRPAQGALPVLYAATADVPGGSYVGPDGPGEMRGSPHLVDRSAAAKDTEVARRLWQLSARLTGTDLPG
ncbi:MAG: oxidoreductase [Nocardioides sp.]|nr:oxidoreductase [Nocardioides sp.]